MARTKKEIQDDINVLELELQVILDNEPESVVNDAFTAIQDIMSSNASAEGKRNQITVVVKAMNKTLGVQY